MSLPCEVAVRSVIPALRAYVAKELTQSYGLKQTDIANLLGITQTAVSKYARHVRGAVLQIENIEEVQVIIKRMCVSLINGDVSRNELVKHFCSACRIIRRKRLMCELCKRSDPTIDINQCIICISKSATCGP